MTKSTRPTSPPVIGLIGSIGAGKSTVAQMLADAGCVVSDSDALARESFHDPAVRDQIIKWWGASLLDSQGKVDRSRIAEIVFPPVNPSAAQRLAADQERKRLEGLVHPWIHARRRVLFAQAAAKAKAFVIDAPLLLESNIQGECDALLMVDAPLSLRLERVRTSRGWVSDELIRRENSQMPLDLKRKVAHHIVNNDETIDSLRAQVAQILSIILDSQPHHC